MKYRDLVVLLNQCMKCEDPLTADHVFCAINNGRVCGKCFRQRRFEDMRGSMFGFSSRRAYGADLHITSLNADVLNNIMKFLDPPHRSSFPTDRYHFALTCKYFYETLWAEPILNEPTAIAPLRRRLVAIRKMRTQDNGQVGYVCEVCGRHARPSKKCRGLVPTYRSLLRTHEGLEICLVCAKHDDVFGYCASIRDARAEFLLDNEELLGASVPVEWPVSKAQAEKWQNESDFRPNFGYRRRRCMLSRRKLKELAYRKHAMNPTPLKDALETAAELRHRIPTLNNLAASYDEQQDTQAGPID